LKNGGESGCGQPKSPENTPKNAKKQQPTEKQKNTKTEILYKPSGARFLQLDCQEGRFNPLPPSVTPLLNVRVSSYCDRWILLFHINSVACVAQKIVMNSSFLNFIYL